MKMKTLTGWRLTASILSMTTVLSGNSQAAAESPLAQANNDFAIDFYKRAGGQAGNVVFSPYSISAAFAMTYAGASGDTASQMHQAMHWAGSAGAIASEFAGLDKLFLEAQKAGAVEISVANALWPQKGYDFRKEYLDLLGRTFKTSLHEADFVKQSEAERARINQWVEQQTRNRIKDLMPAGSIDEKTRLVLANAIYFKARWQDPFTTNLTQPAPFYLAAGGSVNAPLMTRKASFSYALMPTFKLLELPYAGGNLSMLVILPDATNGLQDLEKELSGTKLTEWSRALRRKEVSVFLPKFKMNFQLKLNDTLTRLGMKDAFNDQKADFTGMTGNRDLFISSAMHKAFVEVNEEGTEAAAATGIGVALAPAPPVEVPVFRADHPFLYAIRHNATGTILFFGRLSDPTK